MNKERDGNPRIRDYEILEKSQTDSNIYQMKSKEDPNSGKVLVIVICSFFFIFSVVFIFRIYYLKHTLYLFNLLQVEKKQYEYKLNYYKDLIPKINLMEENNITNISEIFKSRRLFINDNNITNDYIRFIRPINKKEEEKYKKILHSKLSFETFNIERENKINLDNFFKLCTEEKLIDSNKYNLSDNPAISVILPVYNKRAKFMKSLRSIQNQSFKNIEIIVLDDKSTDGIDELLEPLFISEPRIRIFKHLKNMGVWRSRLDGFLYSRGKYILHFDSGDLYADNYVLEDIYDLVSKYNLDSVRFSFSKKRKNFDDNIKVYPKKHLKIIYGRPDYNIYEFGYGTIWNRLFRANIFVKGLDLVDEYILNAYKNLWEDMWWNDLIDRVSFSNLIINRLGYIYLYTHKGAGEPKIKNAYKRNKTIKEFILFWFFDYQLLPKTDNKKIIIDKLKNYNKKDNLFCRIPMRLDFLKEKFYIYDCLLTLLYNDPFVSEEDKIFVKDLYSNYTRLIEEKSAEK